MMMLMRMRKFVVLVVLGLVFLMASGVASATPAYNPITSGLVAAYEFSGNANDVSGNGNDGVVHGATLTADRFGNLDSAYSFSQLAARVEISPVFSSHPSELTYAAWVSDWQNTSGTIYGEFTSGGRTRNYFLAGGTSGGHLSISNYPPAGAPGDAQITPLTAYSDDQWLHIAIVQHGNLVTGYVNGEVLGTGTLDGTYSGATPFVAAIGSRYNPFAGGWVGYGDGTYQFRGVIDDLYIYNRALSPSEVSTLYSPIPEPNTALLLGFGLVGLGVKRRRGASHSADGKAS